MNKAQKRELDDIIIDLRNIITELDSIERDLRVNYAGIGTQRCADSIESVSSRYRKAKNSLEKMDTSVITEGFTGGGGSSSGGGSSRSF